MSLVDKIIPERLSHMMEPIPSFLENDKQNYFSIMKMETKEVFLFCWRWNDEVRIEKDKHLKVEELGMGELLDGMKT